MTGLARLRVDGNRRGRFGMALLAGVAVAATALSGCSGDAAEESLADAGRFAEGSDPRATELTAQVAAEIAAQGLPAEWAVLAAAPVAGTPATAAFDEALSVYVPASGVTGGATTRATGSASPAPAGSAAPAGTQILLGVNDGVENVTQSLLAATSWLGASVADCSGIDALPGQPLTFGQTVNFQAEPVSGGDAGSGGSAICGRIGSALDGSQFAGYFTVATPTDNPDGDSLFGYCLPPSSCTQLLPGSAAATMPQTGKQIKVPGQEYSLNQIVLHGGMLGEGATEGVYAGRLAGGPNGVALVQVMVTTPEALQKGVDLTNSLAKSIFGVEEDVMVIQELAPTQ